MRAGAPNSFKVIAIVAAFNEGDIISQVISHLIENGVSVYLIDNESTDDTIEQASQWHRRGLLGIETLKGEQNGRRVFDWTALLRRKEELANELEADWFIHNDADEFRESPWPNTPLRDGIAWVDSLGYNAIDFRVYNFQPLDDGFRQGMDPRTYFTHYEPPQEFDKLRINAWKKTAGVTLTTSGGHAAAFEGRRIFPIPFVFRHYPIRGQTHGQRKVFAERKGTFVESERKQGWHIQYDEMKSADHNFLRNAAELFPFDIEQARLECMLSDNLVRHLAEQQLRSEAEVQQARSQREALQRGLSEYQAHALALEAEVHRLRRETESETVTVLKHEIEKMTLRIAELERGLEEYRRHTEDLEQQRALQLRAAGELDSEKNRLSLYSDELARELAESQREREESREQLELTKAELNRIYASRAWRWFRWIWR